MIFFTFGFWQVIESVRSRTTHNGGERVSDRSGRIVPLIGRVGTALRNPPYSVNMGSVVARRQNRARLYRITGV